MASSGTQQQRIWLRRQPSGSRSFVLAAPTTLLFFLLVLLFLVVFAQPSSCSRPLPLGVDDHHPNNNNNNNGVVHKAAATDVILLPLLPSVPSQQLAGGRHQWQWLLNKKPRGKAPPSAPSKRTN